ncbi:MAG: hypothetical protein WBQ06_09505 [Acidobacteriaceae bacterium]
MAILPLTSRGRFLWTIVVFLLLISEFRAIREQNAQFLSDKKALNSQFKSIRDTENSDFKITVDKLQTAIHTSEQQFQHTMFRVKQTLTAAQEATKSANAARLNTLPRAMIELHAITSDRRVSAPDLYQGLVPQDFEKQETMHVSFFNRGTAEADEFRYAGKLYLARPGNLADEITVSSEFDRAWKHSAISSDGPIRPSTQPYPAPFKSEGFSGPEMEEVAQGKLAIYYFFRFAYSDNTGRWYTDYCGWFKYSADAIDRASICSVTSSKRYPAPN